MAGNKIHKSKGKDDKNKINKGKGQHSVGADGPDHALLRKPVLTSITGFSQARKIYDWATEELKHLLSHECDVLYECKVCRNIFRSLANFISHKRVYCKEQFNPSEHGHFLKCPPTINELLKIKRLEEEYKESLKENKLKKNTNNDEERIPLTKDLTEVVDRIARKNGLQNGHSERQMILQEIPSSSVAVFQNFNTSGEEVEGMQKQVNELNNMISRSLAVVQHDGNCKMKVLAQDADSVIQISDDDDEQDGDTSDTLKCKACDLQFSTQKTLKFHMKYKHVESRLVYPCPDCLEIFSTSWSVYRHLFKVHRKTAAQIRRLRESIQSKAFRMNNIPAFYEKRKNNAKQAATTKRQVTEEERLDQVNQEWMDNMEGDGSGPRCGGCGRAFERRAALVAHTHTCAPRNRARALAAARRHDAKRIQIQIRRDYHKGPPAEHDGNKIAEEVRAAHKIDTIVPETVDDDGDDTVELGEDNEKSDDVPKSSDKPEVKPEGPPESASNDVLLVPDNTSPDNTQVIRDNPEEKESRVPPDVSLIQDMPPTPSRETAPIIRLPYARNAEDSNLNAFKQKIKPDVELEALLCKRCNNKSGTVEELYSHMAGHYKWMRYACKLCNFKHYTFEKLPEHVKIVHKLKGDKDFYISTVKALDGAEALELSENTDEHAANGNSPDSQRASRCSSDSSRLSDDGSSSSTRMESGAKKRKMQQNKVTSKRKKESPNKNGEEARNDDQGISPEKEVNLVEIDTFSRPTEENSSDMDDVDDKITKRQIIEDIPSMASRRPVRRKTKRKNEDFEYDLSNLLKMEAQGYRDSQTNTAVKSNNAKKKSLQEHQINYENLNKDFCGAMVILSKKAVEKSAAHMKMTSFSVSTSVREQRNSSLFARPLLPKSFNKGDKLSPKKESPEDKTDNSTSPNKELKNQGVSEDVSKRSNNEIVDQVDKDSGDSTTSYKNQDNITGCHEVVKTNLNKPAVVPLKLRGQSVELLKNPLINSHIKSLTKPKLASKILVIKPFKRDSDSLKGLNTPVQYQTITVKDSNNDPLSENKTSLQKLVVEVPKVDSGIARTSVDTSVVSKVPPVISDASIDSTKKSSDDSCEHVKKLNFSSDIIEQTNGKSSASDNSFDFKKEIKQELSQHVTVKEEASIEYDL